MNRRELIMAGMAGTAFAARPSEARRQSKDVGTAAEQPGTPPAILLNDYVPESIYRIPITEVPKAKFRVFDGHNHGHGPLSVTEMVRIMDKVGVEKSVVFSG
ncbi:MAG: hypothetical protein ACRD4G_14460, partial [Bryobacteraceae bacterium]